MGTLTAPKTLRDDGSRTQATKPAPKRRDGFVPGVLVGAWTLGVPCPTCHASVGARCTRTTGRAGELTNRPHAARKRLAGGILDQTPAHGRYRIAPRRAPAFGERAIETFGGV